MTDVKTLHPLAWWGWGICLAIASSRTQGVSALRLIIIAASIVAFSRKSNDPWSAALAIGIKISLVALTLRMFIAILFGVPGQGQVLFTIPRIRLPEWMAGILLGGDVTLERIRFVFAESLTIFALIIAIAAASSLANPKQTLRTLPGILHEAGVALIIATTLIPHFAMSVRRIRQARMLRGDQQRFGFKKTLVPLFEESLERALVLAESMEARGYGRNPARKVSSAPAVMLLLGLVALLFALLQLVIGASFQLPLLASALLVVSGLIIGNKQNLRTRYRPIPWRRNETFVMISSIVLIVISGFATNIMVALALLVLTLTPLLVTSREVNPS